MESPVARSTIFVTAPLRTDTRSVRTANRAAVEKALKNAKPKAEHLIIITFNYESAMAAKKMMPLGLVRFTRWTVIDDRCCHTARSTMPPAPSWAL